MTAILGSHRLTVLLAAAAFLSSLPQNPSRQPTSPPRGWPCDARIDRSYFQIAEGSGGQLLLLAPEEMSEAATLLTTPGTHRQTIVRQAGTLEPGMHEMQVPIDPSVESVMFSISAQCLQQSQVLRPSGEPASGEGVTDLSNFRAQRMVIVARPESGTWTVRFWGSGLSGVMVQARSPIGISQPQFAAVGSNQWTPLLATGVENAMRVEISGNVGGIRAALVTGEYRKIADIPIDADETPGSYRSRFTPETRGFRLLVTGTDADGVPFQRMHAPLLTVR